MSAAGWFGVGMLAGIVIGQLAMFAFMAWAASRKPVDIDWSNASRR